MKHRIHLNEIHTKDIFGNICNLTFSEQCNILQVGENEARLRGAVICDYLSTPNSVSVCMGAYKDVCVSVRNGRFIRGVWPRID